MHLSFHSESKINNYNNITDSNIHNQTRISAHLQVRTTGRYLPLLKYTSCHPKYIVLLFENSWV